jgi:hypothetical protein
VRLDFFVPLDYLEIRLQKCGLFFSWGWFGALCRFSGTGFLLWRFLRNRYNVLLLAGESRNCNQKENATTPSSIFKPIA